MQPLLIFSRLFRISWISSSSMNTFNWKLRMYARSDRMDHLDFPCNLLRYFSVRFDASLFLSRKLIPPHDSREHNSVKRFCSDELHMAFSSGFVMSSQFKTFLERDWWGWWWWYRWWRYRLLLHSTMHAAAENDWYLIPIKTTRFRVTLQLRVINVNQTEFFCVYS